MQLRKFSNIGTNSAGQVSIRAADTESDQNSGRKYMIIGSDDLPEDFRECIRFHGHFCPRLAIGYPR